MNANSLVGRHHLPLGRLFKNERTVSAGRRSTGIPFALFMGMGILVAAGSVEHPGGDTVALAASASLMRSSLALATTFAALALAEEINFSCFSCFFPKVSAQGAMVVSF
jgi:hypothetical protein